MALKQFSGLQHSGDFDAAVQSLRNATPRSEVSLEEGPAPARLAPHAVALNAEVWVDDPENSSEQIEGASGRFVLLHDPAGQDAWNGTFRIVAFLRATIERDLASDPLLNDVAWDWLTEALENRGAAFHALSGTVTRTLSSSFGDLEQRPPRGDVEMRCSWTMTGSGSTAGDHLLAWTDLLTMAAGLPPLPPGVTALPRR